MNTEQRYDVTRWCCRSGKCSVCRANGDASKRRRVTQAANLPEDETKKYLTGWKHHEPKVEPCDD